MDLRRGERGVLRVGHRGAAALAAENSLEAIEAAAAHGLDAVELDVLRAPDGALVLAHGPELTPGAATLNWTVASPAAVAACHGAGAAVFFWTVNDAQMARTLVEMGADGIITDDPGILLSW